MTINCNIDKYLALENPPSPTIFINYRRIDSGWPATYLSEKIEATFRKKPFLNVRSIDAGDDFTLVIDENLRKATILFVLIGKKWMFLQDKYGKRKIDNYEDWVRHEIREGLHNDNCTVIPVLLDDADLPNETEALNEAARAAENLKAVYTLNCGIKRKSQLFTIKGVYHESIRSKPL